MRAVFSGAFVALLLFSLVMLVPKSALAGGGGGGGGGSKGSSSGGVHLNFGGSGWNSGWRYGSGYSSYPYHGYSYPYYSYRYNYPAAVPAVAAVPNALARIVNPATNGVGLTFWVNNQQFVLPAGMQQDVSFVPGQAIQFDRGPGRGTAQYSLESVTYTFSPTPIGWELYRTDVGASAANIAAGNLPAAGNPPAPGTTPTAIPPTLPTANAPVPITR